MAERREEIRANVEVEVNFRTVQEFLAAYSKNISGGGILIRTQQPQPLNKIVLLRFTLPGLLHRFEVNGIVVWSNPITGRSSFPAGMGIKFVNLGAQDGVLIAEFVAKAAEAVGLGGAKREAAQQPAPPASSAAQPVPPPPRLPAPAPPAQAPQPTRSPAAGQPPPSARPAPAPSAGQAVKPPPPGAPRPATPAAGSAPVTQKVPPPAGTGPKKP